MQSFAFTACYSQTFTTCIHIYVPHNFRGCAPLISIIGYIISGDSLKKHGKSTKPTKLESRRDVPSMGQIELSMSPIGEPSTLDTMMDVTTMSSVDQDISFYGAEHVKEQPKVSTLKLPHLLGQGDCRPSMKTTEKVYVTVQSCMWGL